MPYTPNYGHWVCDRNNEHAEDAPADDQKVKARWHNVERITKDGNKQSWWFCDACFKDYQVLTTTQDDDFAKFMRGE